MKSFVAQFIFGCMSKRWAHRNRKSFLCKIICDQCSVRCMINPKIHMKFLCNADCGVDIIGAVSVEVVSE